MDSLGKILIADDEEVFRNMTAELLRRAGYHCDEAANATSATALLDNEEYDLLLADIRMAGNENLELLGHSRIRAGTPVILLTGYPTVASVLDGFHRSIFDYFVKPFEFADLLDRVKKALSAQRTVKTIQRLTDRLDTWRQESSALKNALETRSSITTQQTLEALAKLAYGHAVETLKEVNSMDIQVEDKLSCEQLHSAVGCPKLNIYSHAIKDTIAVLERTKSAFKSKELGLLRLRLEQILAPSNERNRSDNDHVIGESRNEKSG